jgi:hypothetical protein
MPPEDRSGVGQTGDGARSQGHFDRSRLTERPARWAQARHLAPESGCDGTMGVDHIRWHRYLVPRWLTPTGNAPAGKPLASSVAILQRAASLQPPVRRWPRPTPPSAEEATPPLVANQGEETRE